MDDHLNQSDQEEVCEPTYDQLLEFFENIHASYRKLKKSHTSLKLEFSKLHKEHKILLKDHFQIDSKHMSLLDEFDDLNKKHSELVVEHNSLKASYTSLESDFKIYIDESEHREHYLRVDNVVLESTSSRFKAKLNALEEKRTTPILDLKPKPRKRHYNPNILVNLFSDVRYFSCDMLG
ncbi:hypothetical protein KFK09_023964 [Dendrobium nobile]|uniref:Uncharacterized protein n=1 Tax=Dendrobium nobile TaxID=94219 RepID=A0A8T3ACJ4_DENNO|nr:hypothetical protein KFK09_023964 [Dendrobium nobile]